jgi:nitroimidazol reductase NimA-like FMN-containing flavoprotein (pyridoxamine 5'-phosphate oxidase superfamily)
MMSAVTQLGTERCWELLRSVPVGRLAVIVADRPEIFPVNHVVDRGTIIFRTADGTKMSAALQNPLVAFEVDGYDEVSGQAWSVVVKGRAEQIRQLHELLDTPNLPLTPWQADPKPRFVRIAPEEVTGRRFPLVDPARWDTVLSGVRPNPLD